MSRRRILPLAAALLTVACGEPIDSKSAREDDATKRTLPVVATGRVDTVGEAFRVAIVVTRAARGVTSRTEYVDVVTAVENGTRTAWDRHLPDGTVVPCKASGTGRVDFSLFEQLLPKARSDVPEAWRVEGVWGALRQTTALSEMPPTGGSAELRIESVQVRQGQARAVMPVAFRAETAKGPIVLAGRIEHDLKHKLLVLAELDGTVGDEKISIRATRELTRFVPKPKR